MKLPIANQTTLAAVSGGADSTALLLALHELIQGGKLSLTLFVAHLDHGLRTASKKDAQWVSRLAKRLGYTAVVGHADVAKLALKTGDNLEQTARHARYAFLERTAKRKGAESILIAHTMDDQAETVLLRLLRGSASEGLSGMEAIRPLRPGSQIKIIRPLLSWALRGDTEAYCLQQEVTYLSDEMNDDQKLARVKVRKQLLPLMQSFNSRIVEALSRTATLLREDNTALGADAANLLRLASQTSESKNSETDPPPLNVSILSRAPSALRRRALREWISRGRGDLRRLERVHLLAVESLLTGNRGARTVELPDGAKVLRKKGRLELHIKKG